MNNIKETSIKTSLFKIGSGELEPTYLSYGHLQPAGFASFLWFGNFRVSIKPWRLRHPPGQCVAGIWMDDEPSVHVRLHLIR